MEAEGVSDVYAALLDAIDAGLYRPGERLKEIELAARFGVSRTPVREALGRLESQGLVARDGRRGLTVAALDAHELGELYDLREMLEGFAARLAARRASPAEIEVLAEMVAADRGLVGTGDVSALARANKRFHRALHLAAHNRFLEQALDGMRRSLALLSGTTLGETHRQGASIDEHAAIVAAIAARDEAAAEAAARLHIVNAYKTRLKRSAEARGA
ncbi:MAG: GntR family transcriptional regulator [Pikeienuella sp.]